MVYLTILTIIVLTGLVIGAITDLKKREVPDWLSYGLISVGLGLNLLFSLVYWDYWFFVNSLIGLLLFLVIALAMFYMGQWGGGDSKILMALGALIGLDIRFQRIPFLMVDKVYNFTQLEKIPNFLVNLFVNILLIGAIYGLLWSFILILKNKKDFLKEFNRISENRKMRKIRNYIMIFVILMIISAIISKNAIFGFAFFVLSISTPLTFYLYISIKSIERTCMIKKITPDKLTEGDWIAKEIKYNGKYICGPRDLGIEKKQIKRLVTLYKQNKIKNILIKEGIPFVPSFLIAYIITLFFGNLFFLIISSGH